MSLVRITLLFDYKNFEIKITPALDALRRGSFDELRMLANDIVTKHPQVWSFLDDLGYFPTDLGSEEESFNDKEGYISFWITLIICGYCLRADGLMDFESSPDILSQLGVSKDIIRILIWGRPMSDLLSSLTNLVDKSKDYPFKNLGFKIGWLSIEDIEYVKTKIQIYQKKNSHAVYEKLLVVLDAAIQSKNGLILGVAV